MNFQWILIAIFAVALLSGIVKALFRPMLKNTLRLLCVPVAFLLTFILQVCGLFQLAVSKLIGLLDLASMLPGYDSVIEVLIAFCSTLLSPTLFVAVFFLILWILRLVHVNLVARFIEKRRVRAEKEELKLEIKEEKKKVKEAIRENEKILEQAEEKGGEKSIETIIAENYKAPDNDEIEEMVEARVEREKKAKKKAGFFKETKEKKAISVVSGAVSAFLIMGVAMMPVFHTMSALSSVTEGIRSSDADDSQIYQIVEVLDNHIVEPYEASFVTQLYRSLALEDLMNFTVRAGGRIVLDNGKAVYIDDVMKTFLTHGVSAAAQLTSGKSNQEKLPEDLGVLTGDPLVVSVLADSLSTLMQGVEAPEVSGDEDIVNSLVAGIINHYKTADKEIIAKDLESIDEMLVVLIDSGMLNTLVSGGDVDFESMLADGDLLGDLLSSMASLSAFPPVVSTTFTMGIDLLAGTLQIPEGDAEAYDILMRHIHESVIGDTAKSFNMSAVERFMKNCSESGKKADAYGAEDADGYAEFLEYFVHWSKIQMAFASGSEDLSLGYLTLEIGSQTYMYDASSRKISVIDPAASEHADKISPIADLIHYLAKSNPSKTMDMTGLEALLATFNGSEASEALCAKLLNKDTFVSNGVTIEKMKAAMEFDDWTEAEKEADGALCAEIVSSLLGLMDTLDTAGNSEVTGMIDQFGSLGKTMDLMAETSCLKELPPLLLEGLVKNDMFSQYLSPSLVNQINDKVQNDPDISYEAYMSNLANTVKILVESAGGVK